MQLNLFLLFFQNNKRSHVSYEFMLEFVLFFFGILSIIPFWWLNLCLAHTFRYIYSMFRDMGNLKRHVLLVHGERMLLCVPVPGVISYFTWWQSLFSTRMGVSSFVQHVIGLLTGWTSSRHTLGVTKPWEKGWNNLSLIVNTSVKSERSKHFLEKIHCPLLC